MNYQHLSTQISCGHSKHTEEQHLEIGVSINGRIPKVGWLIMENPYIYIYICNTVYIYKWMIWGYPLFRKSPNSEHSNIASPVTHRPRFGRPVFDCWYRVAGLNVSPLSHMLRGYFSKKMKMILMGKYGIIWDYMGLC